MNRKKSDMTGDIGRTSIVVLAGIFRDIEINRVIRIDKMKKKNVFDNYLYSKTILMKDFFKLMLM